MKRKCLALILLFFVLIAASHAFAEENEVLAERVTCITLLDGQRAAVNAKGIYLEGADGQWLQLETSEEQDEREESVQTYAGMGSSLYSVAQVLRAHYSVNECPICDYYLCVQNWDGKELSELQRLYRIDCGITYGSTLKLMMDEEAAYWFMQESATGAHFLFRIQLSDGKATELLAQLNIINVIESDDPTSFFVVYRTFEGEYGAPCYYLASFDRRDGTQHSEPLTLAVDASWLADSLVAYDAASGQMYGTFPDEDKLYCLNPDGASRQSGYLEPGEYSGALIEDGEFVLYGWDGCQRAKLEQEIVEPELQLRIAGGVSDDVLQAFRELHPEVEVVEAQGYISREEFAQQMVLQDSTYDLYLMDYAEIGFQNVMKKHYCMNLAGSEKIQAVVQGMVPEVLSRVTDGDGLYALPLYYGAAVPAYDAETLKAMGLTEADLPTTFGELLDFVEWFDKNRDGYEEPVYLFNHVFVYRAMVRMLTCAQVHRSLQAGQPMSVDSLEYRALLERLTALRPVIERCSWMDSHGFCDGKWLFEESVSVLGYESYRPLFLSMAPGEKPCAEGYIGIAFINPYTKHPELTLELMELVAESLSDLARINLYPDENEPVLNDEWTQEMAELEKQLEEKQAELAAADPEDVRDLQMEVDGIQAYIDGLDIPKYLVSEEQILSFRTRAYDIVIAESDWRKILQGDFTASSLMRRLEDGALSVDGFVDLLAREMWMRQEEDK